VDQSPIAARTIDLLRQASVHLSQGRPANAIAILQPMIRDMPALVEARRLLGLALRLTGDFAGAERELRAALAREDRAELHEALASTLEAAGRRPEAEAAYRAALAIDPLNQTSAIDLSELLLNENRLDEALAVIEPLGRRPEADIHALSAYALALKAMARTQEAIEVYQRAIKAAPTSAVAEHNLAAILADDSRYPEAEAGARRAFAKGIDAPQTWLTLARALQGQDRFDEADHAFRQVIRRNPLDLAAQRELAQLLWMRSEAVAEACAVIDQTRAAFPDDVGLIMARARVLEYAGDADGAYDFISAAIDRQDHLPDLHVQASYLAAKSHPQRALDHARRAWFLAPQQTQALNALILANLAVGDAAAAAELATEMCRRAPNDQHALAQLATAWRMLEDPRYAELYDYDAMVGTYIIEPPSGWSSLTGFLGDLAAVLERRHPLRTHPIGQSLRHGTQTQQRLDRSDDPVIAAFFHAIDEPIRQHMRSIGDGADPLRARNTGDYRIQGVWSSRLRPNGFHADHIHQEGWLSSACYIALPDAIERGHEGWIKFGQPGVPTRPDLGPERFVKPAPGALVLFPSYMWHGTAPFSGDQYRMTIAADFVPT
jgi:tetratricopeptide (TPR) repeat protein